MEKYIAQLLEEMLSAHRVQNEDISEPDLDAHFADIDRYTSGDADQLIRKILDIDAGQFPPAEQLNDEQLGKVVDGFQALLLSWNLCAEFPENLPLVKRYQLLIATLDKEAVVMNYGMVHLEFCEYDPETCPFGTEFCSCENFEGETL